MQGQAHTIETRYLSDPVFHQLVDTMTAIALEKDWTPTDFIDAIRAADVRIREEQIRRLDSEDHDR